MGLAATPFLAKSVSDYGAEGSPDSRLRADDSGGTVADFHGLPRFSRLPIVKWECSARSIRCQCGVSLEKEFRGELKKARRIGADNVAKRGAVYVAVH